MRLLLAVHAFPPRSTAGVEVYALRCAQALSAAGHEVRVLAGAHDMSATPGELRRRRFAGVEVVEVVNLHQRGTLEATYADPDVGSATERLLDELAPEVVHVHHLINLTAGLIPAARRRGAAVVMTLHDYWLSCPRDGLRQRADLGICERVDHRVCATCLADSPYLVPAAQARLAGALRGAGLGRVLHRLHDAAPRLSLAASRALRRASPPAAADLERDLGRRAEQLRGAAGGVDRFLAPTRFALDRAIEFGVPRERAALWRLGVLREASRPRRDGPRRRIGYVGTLAPHKGAHVLLEAFARVPVPDARLELFGSLTVAPDYAAELRRRAGRDPRVRLRGPFPEGEQSRVLDEVDVLALPSLWWENSPLTVLEALGAGVPVIASRIGGVPELLEAAGSGLLVPPGDLDALAEALEAVLAGRALAGPAPAPALKTVAEEASALGALYAQLAGTRG